MTPAYWSDVAHLGKDATRVDDISGFPGPGGSREGHLDEGHTGLKAKVPLQYIYLGDTCVTAFTMIWRHDNTLDFLLVLAVYPLMDTTITLLLFQT